MTLHGESKYLKWAFKFIEKIMVKYLFHLNQDILKDNKIWWRDDDSFELNDKFKDLIDFQKKRNINVYLSIIPSKITTEFIQIVNNTNGVYVFPHGYAHINHSDDDVILNEYPETRDSDQVSNEISESVKKLKVNFPSKYLPVFVPPWEHYSAQLLAILPKHGLRTISLSGYIEDLPKQIMPLNVQINFHTYKNISPNRYIIYHKKLLSICREIISASKTNRNNRIIGLLTHHNDMNKNDWNNYNFILSELNRLGCQELSYNEMWGAINEKN